MPRVMQVNKAIKDKQNEYTKKSRYSSAPFYLRYWRKKRVIFS